MANKMEDANPEITNLSTLTRFLLSAEHVPVENRIELSNLFTGITLACKITSNAIKRAGFDELFGVSGQVNVHAEEVKKLDLVANSAFVTALKSTKEVCVMVSEEEENAVIVEKSHAGKFAIAFDPLDGSANLDANVSVGSIFSIWPKKSAGDLGSTEDVLRSGRDMTVGGYALYGSTTMLVLTLGKGVYGFTLDQAVGEFLLTHPNIKIKPRGNIYSINEGNSVYWEKGTQDYVAAIKSGKGKAPYSSRYIGSMVADVHRTLLYGGIFMYPADSKSPNGKLRYLYEVAPLSFIMEQAGGKASTGKIACLDIVPDHIHKRVPVFMGSKDDVTDLESFHK
eukprot:Phypoly_transcript_11762.p1 GENE.Phypoly_transcript_11762~~Phypoly_transcript_11762.p1  ORF type:complete len:339 (+),score=53.13 Phypoly_transcript_11762:109-1125(+)